MQDLYTLECLSADVDMEEYIKNCVDVERFVAYCRECGNYGKRWSCPPFDFDPLTIWRRYKTIHIEGRVLRPLSGAKLADILAGMEREKAGLLAELFALEAANPGAQVLSAGTCRVCGGECARVGGCECRFPDKMRYSMEAIGGDVAKTAEIYLHKPMLWIKQGEMPDYLMLVLGVLLP